MLFEKPEPDANTKQNYWTLKLDSYPKWNCSCFYTINNYIFHAWINRFFTSVQSVRSVLYIKSLYQSVLCRSRPKYQQNGPWGYSSSLCHYITFPFSKGPTDAVTTFTSRPTVDSREGRRSCPNAGVDLLTRDSIQCYFEFTNLVYTKTIIWNIIYVSHAWSKGDNAWKNLNGLSMFMTTNCHLGSVSTHFGPVLLQLNMNTKQYKQKGRWLATLCTFCCGSQNSRYTL